MTSNQTKSVPGNHILAVVGESAVEGTLKDLTRSGYTATKLFRGEAAANEIDAKGDHSGPLGKVVKMVSDHLSEETNYLAQYEEEARNGNIVLAVPVSKKEDVDAAREIMERHGAHNIRHFGTMAVTDLSPLTNPSFRSSDSPEEQAKGNG